MRAKCLTDRQDDLKHQAVCGLWFLTAVHEVQTLIYSCFCSNCRFRSRLTAPYIRALYRKSHNGFDTLCGALCGQFVVLSLVAGSPEVELIWVLHVLSVTVVKDSSLSGSKVKPKMMLVLLVWY